MFGFVRVAAAVPQVRVADCRQNVSEMEKMIDEALQERVAVLCFPELGITAYTCADLFFQQHLQQEALAALRRLRDYTTDKPIVVLAGAPLVVGNALYNCAFVLNNGQCLGVVPKIHLPNNAEFYEKRWFISGRRATETSVYLFDEEVPFGTDLLFAVGESTFGVELCEDLWSPLPPSTQLALQGAEIIFNLSASNELIGKNSYRQQLVAQQSARTHTAYVYVSAGTGESTTDVVFSGSALIAENGVVLSEGKRFAQHAQLLINEVDIERLRIDRQRNTNFDSDKLGIYRHIVCPLTIVDSEIVPEHRTFAQHPFVPSIDERTANCREIFDIQTAGLAKRWLHTKVQTLVLGISGGLDSTLALLVCVKTADLLGFDRKRIVGVTMPGFGTTDRTYRNAVNLMKALGITWREISIKQAVQQHFKDIAHAEDVHDVTYENSQARERTQILMDLSNQLNGLVIGTGDLSELALGWATYNGDQMSMYGVNAGIPKTLVRYLVAEVAFELDKSAAEILTDILTTPVSPELLPADKYGKISQKTEDLVGPYELHDFFLYYLLRFGFSKEKIAFLAKRSFAGIYEDSVIDKWLNTFMKRFFQQQFKRSCMPDGPKIGSVNLSPRGDWRMPSDACGW